jgi:pimeloyl-ACP methyl ester carboxylesterase
MRTLALLVLAATVLAQPQSPTTAPRPPDRFVTVAGIRLHYLDWGGHGDVLLFLPGLGATAHTFDSFAPKFTSSFHVLGLTRRGQGLSDRPPSRYDTPTLAEDIRRFLDVMGIQRVALIGHSIAGVEMTRFAGAYPSRVSKLVYLDAASDWARMHELLADAQIPYPPYPNEFEAAIDTNQSHPDLTTITSPALAFFVIFDAAYAAQSETVLCPGCTGNVAKDVKRFWLFLQERNFWSEQAEQFRRKVKRGRVVLLRGTNHFFFQDSTQVANVEREIRMFLAARVP